MDSDTEKKEGWRWWRSREEARGHGRQLSAFESARAHRRRLRRDQAGACEVTPPSPTKFFQLAGRATRTGLMVVGRRRKRSSIHSPHGVRRLGANQISHHCLGARILACWAPGAGHCKKKYGETWSLAGENHLPPILASSFPSSIRTPGPTVPGNLRARAVEPIPQASLSALGDSRHARHPDKSPAERRRLGEPSECLAHSWLPLFHCRCRLSARR